MISREVPSSSRVTTTGELDLEEVDITFDGQPITARIGESLAAALTAAGISQLRTTSGGADRGVFCGMGVCQDCLVNVDGKPNRRACMTTVNGPMIVRSGIPRVVVSAVAKRSEFRTATVAAPEIVVVGAGAAGLSAAIAAAEAGAEVVVLDERPAAGGQYFKQPASIYVQPGQAGSDRQFEGGRQLIERARRAGVKIVNGAEAWGAFPPLEVCALTPEGPATYRPQRMIVATGAYERGLPVPGWTLPGVMTTGAAQTLLRSYRTMPARRVLIAGNGPLNLQVGLELARAGCDVVGIAEAAQMKFSNFGSLLSMAASAPGLSLEGIRYLAGLKRHGVPVHGGVFVTRIDKMPDGLRATLGRWRNGGAEPIREVVADAICLGYGFMPSNELLRLLGAAHDYDPARGQLITQRSQTCETTVAGLYAVGDCCGLGGARAAVEEGIIAGLDAAFSLGHGADPKPRSKAARRRRDRQRRFQSALWRVFAAPRLTTELADPSTVVCRCEEVSLGELDQALENEPDDIGSIKRCTRAGMGRCQGRYCAPVLAAIIARRTGRPLDERSFFAPRPPVKPVTIAEIAGALVDNGDAGG